MFEIADLENDKVCVSDAYVWLLSRIRCSPRTLAYHLSIYLLIRLARFLKNPDFYHFVSTWMFMTPPAFVTAAIKEGPDSEIITGPEDHDSRYSRD
ncbi:hypothetical protein GF326_11120 [Candidatus Bathyarchaeota archaeon]|nr:hypothetical protein [Candidatus Bathyarchaeota archaeon]